MSFVEVPKEEFGVGRFEGCVRGVRGGERDVPEFDGRGPGGDEGVEEGVLGFVCYERLVGFEGFPF